VPPPVVWSIELTRVQAAGAVSVSVQAAPLLLLQGRIAMLAIITSPSVVPAGTAMPRVDPLADVALALERNVIWATAEGSASASANASATRSTSTAGHGVTTEVQFGAGCTSTRWPRTHVDCGCRRVGPSTGRRTLLERRRGAERSSSGTSPRE